VPLGIEELHHVTLTSSDLDRSRAFYGEILGLTEIERPAFPFPGAWFEIAPGQQLHLIVHDAATYRVSPLIDTRDVHFAIRVANYVSAVNFLRSLGYKETTSENQSSAPGSERLMRLQPNGKAGFPQIYLLDPDRHVIEINAAQLSANFQ